MSSVVDPSHEAEGFLVRSFASGRISDIEYVFPSSRQDRMETARAAHRGKVLSGTGAHETLESVADCIIASIANHRRWPRIAYAAPGA